MDPNGILVEFCVDTKPYTDADKDHALAMLLAELRSSSTPPLPAFFRAGDREPTTAPA